MTKARSRYTVGYIVHRSDRLWDGIYLPQHVAKEIELEHKRAQSKGEETAGAKEPGESATTIESMTPERLISQRTLSEAPLETSAKHEHEVSKFQVLVDINQVAQKLRENSDGAQGDPDQARREHYVLGRALRLGALRSVARPQDLFAALDELQKELPSFGDAIEFVRNVQVISASSGRPLAIPPVLLLGPPGSGKSYFCGRLREVLGAGSKWLSMDAPSAGSQLRGSDRAWGNSIHGALFELLALGPTANPTIVLDEIDKAARRQTSMEIDPLAQLYSALEPETARHLSDLSLDVELDASLVTYVATANRLANLDGPLLSRFHIVEVSPLSVDERRTMSWHLINRCLERIGMSTSLSVAPGAAVVLADFTPRVQQRTFTQAIGNAVRSGRFRVTAEDIELVLGLHIPSSDTLSHGRH